MKYSLFVVVILFSSSLCFNLVDKYLKQPRTDTAPVSECGQMNCTDYWCPPFPFINGVCQDNFCTYYPTFDSNVCTDPKQCGVENCECDDDQSPSPGCKCQNDTVCACLNGICQLGNGYLGEYCDEQNFCNIGACIKSKCEFVSEGTNCTGDEECEPQLYCGSLSTCTLRPLCNATKGAQSNGYCEDGEMCYNGVCYPHYTQTLGKPCVYSYNCLPGLGCISNGTAKTCQPVALGTLCNSDGDCAANTQACVCTEPDDSFPMVCTDAGYVKCTQEYADMMTCAVENNCFDYDVADMTTACGQKCTPLIYKLFCCSTCLYPEYADNAQSNMIGSCAHNNITTVDCCSEYPCVITLTSEICKGYTH